MTPSTCLEPSFPEGNNRLRTEKQNNLTPGSEYLIQYRNGRKVISVWDGKLFQITHNIPPGNYPVLCGRGLVLGQRFVDSDVGLLILSGFVQLCCKDFDDRKFSTELSFIRSNMRTSLKKKGLLKEPAGLCPFTVFPMRFVLRACSMRVSVSFSTKVENVRTMYALHYTRS